MKGKTTKEQSLVARVKAMTEETTKDTTNPDQIMRPWIRAVRDTLDNEPWDSQPQPVQLLPWLYLSDYPTVQVFDAIHKERSLLWRHGITHVLTTAAMQPRSVRGLRIRLAGANIQHLYCPGQDIEGYDMIGEHWQEQCRPFLEQVRNSKPQGKVVVHCIAGMNRSGLIAAAAMMVLERKPLMEVVQVLKAKRGTVLSNESFQTQLCALAQQERLLGERPTGYDGDESSEVEFMQPIKT